jgi:histidinol-phosphatase
MTTFAQELEIVSGIVRKAGETALRYWRSGLTADAKADDSPVTLADRECERLIVSALEEHFPADGLLGEEGSAKESRNGRRWIVDPIDGTRDFFRGNPMWSTLVGLEDQGEVVAGFAYFPALNEMATASRGGGAHVNGVAIHASTETEISRSVLSLDAFNHAGRYPWGQRLVEFMEPFWSVRCFGGSYDAVMVSRGMSELWIETAGKPWDFAALKIIAEESGARFFNYSGASSIHGGNAVICAPGLEAVARRFVSQAQA